MTDRDKVKAELDAIIDECRGCDYVRFAVVAEHCTNILTLLKEQEAVEPINSYGTFRCGNCRNIVGYKDGHGRGYQNKFCSKCGKAVKWE